MKEARKKMRKWAGGLVLIVMSMNCASPLPKPEAPPSPIVESAPIPQEVSPASGEPIITAQEDPPASIQPVLVRPRPYQKPDSTPPSEAGIKSEETFYAHTVQYNGETVSIIAAWYTGKVENWEALAKANPRINPDLIFPGDKILIPESLLKTREVITKQFVGRFYLKSKKEKARPKSQLVQPQVEEPKLFGPKRF